MPNRESIMPANSKSCRNCGSDEIFSQEVDSRGGYGPDLLPKLSSFFSSAKFHIQVCGDCGLVEWYVPLKYLDKIKEKFRREAG
jgi:predicted nucleic-acid-binding Zn-ribbon protein